jgi:hypothetical protein
MKSIKLWGVVLVSMVAYAVTSCAVEVDENSKTAQERIFNAYIRANGYENSEVIGDSIYVVERSGVGQGAFPVDSSYAFVRYTAKYTTGEYAAYNKESVAKQLGTYKHTNFYGSFVWPVKMGYISDPLSDIVKNMKPGEKTVSIVAPWLSNINQDYAFASSSAIMVYEIELEDVVDDINVYQDSIMREFSQKYFNGMDTTSKGFYYNRFYKSANEDTLADGVSVSIWYVGRMLDGSVFDTNIEDTAKKYDLYDKTATYNALSAIFYKDDPEKIAEESNYVLGFCKALTSGVTYGDKCFVFFNSDYGYGSTGNLSNGAGIPPFYPISFEMWIEDDN